MDIFLFHSNLESSEIITTNAAHRPAAAFSYSVDSSESLADRWQNCSGFPLLWLIA